MTAAYFSGSDHMITPVVRHPFRQAINEIGCLDPGTYHLILGAYMSFVFTVEEVCANLPRLVSIRYECLATSNLFLERWPSGRRRTPGKCVYGNVSRVRTPPSPPHHAINLQNPANFSPTAGGSLYNARLGGPYRSLRNVTSLTPSGPEGSSGGEGSVCRRWAGAGRLLKRGAAVGLAG